MTPDPSAPPPTGSRVRDAGSSGGLRTIWYMGAKTRLVPEFIHGAVDDLAEPGSTVLDLCAGTAVVARALAGDYRVYANDVQRFSATIARAHLDGTPGWESEIDRLDAERDLRESFTCHAERLRGLCPGALAAEGELLPKVVAELAAHAAGPASEAYRALIAATPVPDPGTGDAGEATAATGAPRDARYAPAGDELAALLAARRRDPRVRPYAQTLLYHGNVYFGLQQAVAIDSLRAAIDALPEEPFRECRRALYLGALLHACSVTTSGTSHFAQPRSPRKESELLAVARRRSLDIEEEFFRALDAIRREWGEHPRRDGRRIFCAPAEELLAGGGPLERGEVDLVYLDPPYTADNYSRFYHLLESLVDYDYPPLAVRRGALTRGRYPASERRFLSEFCSAASVESAFREVAARCRALGAALLVSYSLDSGLLLKHWRGQGEREPRRRFHELFRDIYPHVEIRERELMHSGQGDSNRHVRELLVLCEE